MANKITFGIGIIMLIGVIVSLPKKGDIRIIDNEKCIYTGSEYIEIYDLADEEKLLAIYQK